MGREKLGLASATARIVAWPAVTPSPSREGQRPWGPPLFGSRFIPSASLGLRCGARSPTRGHGVSLQGPPGKSPSQGLCYFAIVLVERKLFLSVKLCGEDVASLQT